MTPVDAYLAGLAPTTRRVATSDLRVLARVARGAACEPAGAPDWERLGVDQGVTLRAALVGSTAPGTANRRLAVLRGVLRSAWQLGVLDRDRLERLRAALSKIPGGRVTRGRTLQWPQVEALLRQARTCEERALVAVLVGCGLRRAEAAALTWDRVTQRAGVTYLRVLGKGNRERLSRLPQWATPELYAWRYRRPGERDRVFQWDGVGIHLVIQRLARRAGLGTLTPHDLRRTYFELCRRSGLDLATISRSMGHSNIATTLKYDRRTDDEVQAELAVLDDPRRLTNTAAQRILEVNHDTTTDDG